MPLLPEQPRSRELRTEIGKRLKLLRKERGLTQQGLAALVQGGLDYTYIGKIERGEQLPSLKILVGISAALNVPLDYFFRDEEAAAGVLFASELRALLGQEKGRELARVLRLLHPDDIPLVTEIIKLLHRHRTVARPPRDAQYDLPNAAEEEDGYGA
jgi:transcriptional regulator with XRE-family HTH domain